MSAGSTNNSPDSEAVAADVSAAATDDATGSASSGTGTEWGWNYGLTDPVIASPFATEANYFSTTGTDATNLNHWTIAIESENAPGVSSPGPAAQSFPITDLTATPLAKPDVATLQVTPTAGSAGQGAYSVDLKTDLYNYTQPGGAGYFTWYAFGENVDLGGGPLPTANVAEFDANLLYNAWLPNAGARATVMWQAYWNNQSFEIEIDLNRASTDWGASTGTLVQYTRTSPGVLYVQLNGAALGLTLLPGVQTHVHIDWGTIIQSLVAQGVLPAPVGGWSNTVSQAAYVSTELMNQSPTGAGITDMWINNYAVSSSAAGDASTVTPANGNQMFNLTDYQSGWVLTDSMTGATVQTLPTIASDQMQFISIDNRTYGVNLASAEARGLDPSQLKDFNGNPIGAVGQWSLLGIASLRPGDAPSYVLANSSTGRWAEAAVQANGSINLQGFGQNGDTRVAGIYIDPGVADGSIPLGSPYDSQTRFLSDVQANRLNLMGSVFDQEAGGMDLIFRETNNGGGLQNAVFLRAILHSDGNIAYANYMTAGQFTAWAQNAQLTSSIYNPWLTQS